MGRLPRHLILLSAVLGLAGCILFTDPINGAPKVTILAPNGTAVTRGASASFRATVKDEDSESSFLLNWATLPPGDRGCGVIKWNELPLDKAVSRSIDDDFSFEPTDVSPVCVCAVATDHHGAPGIGCLRVEPVVALPAVTIEDRSSPAPSSGAHPLCSTVHLATNWPEPDKDEVEYAWKVTDPSGASLQPSKCTTSDATAAPDRHCCFVAATQGTYVVSLLVKDTYLLDAGGSKGTAFGNAKDFEVVVSPDQSPCLQSTEPGLYAKLVVLSRDTDMTTDESRTFTVDSVADDCQPYPSTAPNPSQLVWSIYDGTSAAPSWKTLLNSSSSLKISQSSFPNAHPGDSIKVRVEARDTLVQKRYQTGWTPCPPETEICESRSGCVAWTTWTVLFQP